MSKKRMMGSCSLCWCMGEMIGGGGIENIL